MSGLARLLAGRAPSGAYRWRAAYDVDDVRHTVESTGRPFAHLDGVAVGSVPELHAALSAALDFPDHYGANLDALVDCLRDVDPATVLLWDAWAPFARAEPRVFAIALEVLGGAISVLVRGDGPDVGLPLLD
ncbi:barstar family protein [Nocardioides sp. C4-1]|uniref:barstar family protein n=1 Tax=Nocardioides sp. C4-1 TaxID=3151851 RepID=UPI003266D233